MPRLLVVLMTLVFVMAACGGSSADNPANAEAMVEAIYGSDDEALSVLPWGNTAVERDAVGAREFALTVNAVLLESSCAATDANFVSCQVRTDDDLMQAIGAEFLEETWEVRFTEPGEIAQYDPEATGDGAADAFFNWAFQTYPNLCDSPAQCATALLGIVDEYLDT
jgi:hypothetical protein